MNADIPKPVCEEISHLISRLGSQFANTFLRRPRFNFEENRNGANPSTQDGPNTSESVQKNYEVPQNRVFDFQTFNFLAPCARNFSLPSRESRDLTPNITSNQSPIVFLHTFGCFLIDCCTIWRSSIAHAKVESGTGNCLKTERKNLVPCYTPS